MAETATERGTIETALLKIGVPEADLAKIIEKLAALRLINCRPGDLIIKEGDKPGPAYITHTGRVEVFKHTGGKQDAKIAEIAPGTVFGEMALLTGFARSATVKAQGRAEVWELTPKDFHMLLHESPAFKARMDALVEERRRALARV